MPENKEERKLFNRDFENSAIDPRSAKKYNVILLNPAKCEQYTGFEVPGAAYIYHDVHGDMDTEPFLRIKYLRKPPKSAWTGKDPGKYWQQAHSGSRIYFPLTVDWAAIAADPDRPIIITEGERKAICGCEHGLNVCAIAGVANWKSTKHFNRPTIPDLDVITWQGRTVYLGFDADVVTNPHVTKQLNDLAQELTRRGARNIKIIEIPATTHLGPKIGMDDFIFEFGIEPYEALLGKASLYRNSEALWKLNERFAFIQSVGAVWDFKLWQWQQKQNFYDITAPIKVTRTSLKQTRRDAEPTTTISEDPANDEWWKWAQRRTYTDHAYLPGEESLESDTLNLWNPYPQEPEPGDVQPFLDLFSHVCYELTTKQLDWFWRWLAWPLQNASTGKLSTAVMIHSKIQGSGKTFIGDIMRDIYGDNALLLSDIRTAIGDHNDILDCRQFVCADEVLVGSRRETDRLKNLVTAEQFVVNPKGVKAYTRKMVINWLFSSNHHDALKLTPEDRRWFVIHAQEKPLSMKLIRELRKWRKNGGPGALHWHLLNDVDCSRFEPWQRPLTTDAHSRMVSSARSEVDEWVHTLKNDPSSVFMLDQVEIEGDLYTQEDLFDRHLVPDYLRGKGKALTNALIAAGFERRDRVKSTKHWRGEKKLWALRNPERWAGEPSADWAEHYVQHSGKRFRAAKHTPKLKPVTDISQRRVKKH